MNNWNFRSSIIGDTISDELITSHTKDLLFIQQLKDTTLTCEACKKRHIIDQTVGVTIIELP